MLLPLGESILEIVTFLNEEVKATEQQLLFEENFLVVQALLDAGRTPISEPKPRKGTP